MTQAGGELQRAFRGSADPIPDSGVKHTRIAGEGAQVPQSLETAIGAEPHDAAAPEEGGTGSPEDPQTPPPSSRLQVPAEAQGLLRSQTALPRGHVVPILPSLKHQLVLLLHV